MRAVVAFREFVNIAIATDHLNLTAFRAAKQAAREATCATANDMARRAMWDALIAAEDKLRDAMSS